VLLVKICGRGIIRFKVLLIKRLRPKFLDFIVSFTSSLLLCWTCTAIKIVILFAETNALALGH
jgi:hypothetical protein